MGDLLMSVPAIRAIKKTFNCKITVLCSNKAMEVAGMIEEIDDRIAFDLPWLKFDNTMEKDVNGLLEILKEKAFDGCILFNVYSQNPAPCLMLAYLAGIKLRAAYSRENLYGLLTHWLVDEEPFSVIRHQVERDLHLANYLGAETEDDRLRIREPHGHSQLALIEQFGLASSGYFILHTGVSEKKRQFPKSSWIDLAKLIIERYNVPIVLTGSNEEIQFTEWLESEIGSNVKNLSGKLDLNALVAVIKHAAAMISVNTGPMHLAVALSTPLIALYAQTNPQHKPYKAIHKTLEYSVPKELQSSNQIIAAANQKCYFDFISYPTPQEIIKSLNDLMDELCVL